MSLLEAERKKRRRASNRKSAVKYRQKKQEYLKELEIENTFLKKQNEILIQKWNGKRTAILIEDLCKIKEETIEQKIKLRVEDYVKEINKLSDQILHLSSLENNNILNLINIQFKEENTYNGNT